MWGWQKCIGVGGIVAYAEGSAKLTTKPWGRRLMVGAAAESLLLKERVLLVREKNTCPMLFVEEARLE